MSGKPDAVPDEKVNLASEDFADVTPPGKVALNIREDDSVDKGAWESLLAQ